MDRLPSELADLITSHSSYATLKSLRLVSKLYHDTATPLVFEHYYMGYFPYYVEKLCHLAKTPTVAKHVKKFTIFSDLIPDWPQW